MTITIKSKKVSGEILIKEEEIKKLLKYYIKSKVGDCVDIDMGFYCGDCRGTITFDHKSEEHLEETVYEEDGEGMYSL